MTRKKKLELIEKWNLPKTLEYGGYHPIHKCLAYMDVPIEDAIKDVAWRSYVDEDKVIKSEQIPVFKKKVLLFLNFEFLYLLSMN